MYITEVNKCRFHGFWVNKQIHKVNTLKCLYVYLIRHVYPLGEIDAYNSNAFCIKVVFVSA